MLEYRQESGVYEWVPVGTFEQQRLDIRLDRIHWPGVERGEVRGL